MTSLEELAETPSWEWPESAGEKLEAWLDTGTDDERLAAAVLAAEPAVLGRLVGPLLRLVSQAGAPAALRALAVRAFSEALDDAEMLRGEQELDRSYDAPLLDDKELGVLIRKLESLYRDSDAPRLLRCAALETSAHYPQRWHEDAVRVALRSGDPDLRRSAFVCMGYVGGFDSEILDALAGATDADEVCELVRAAGLRELRAAGPRVLSLLEDTSQPKPVRLAAIQALPSLDLSEARNLLSALEQSGDPEIAAAAREAKKEVQAFSQIPPADAT